MKKRQRNIDYLELIKLITLAVTLGSFCIKYSQENFVHFKLILYVFQQNALIIFISIQN